MLPPQSPVSRLSGVGPAVARDLARAGVERLADLLWLLPVGYDDLAGAVDVAEAVRRAPERPWLAVKGRVRSANIAFVRRRRATRIVIEGTSGAKLTLWWFFAAQSLLGRAAPGREVVVVGRPSPEKRGAGALMAHPDLFASDAPMPRIRPRYPRAGLSPARIGALVAQALDASEPPELVPAEVRAREGFAPLGPLLRALHDPPALPEPASILAAREQLAWAEAFCRVLSRRARDQAIGERPAVALPRAPEAIERFVAELGFSWTAGQARAIAEIGADLTLDRPMRRLLLGDVGSGKTAVALAAIAQAIAAAERAVVLAPTTVLADQYRAAAAPLERALGCRVELLTGATPAAAKKKIELALSARDVSLLIGTHALLEAGVELGDPALIVVDEQQRFGVAQRRAIVSRAGSVPHVLTLSATPIPRTLALALRGELEMCTLADLPPGRLPVETALVPRSAFSAEVLPAIRAALERHEGAFVVCPRIGGEDDEGRGAVERHAELVRQLGAANVVLAHGRLAQAKLGAAIERFRSGQAGVLVGTTVVEVGIDVPHASLMVIDGAESFGLAQLHQLRGRVGRSARRSRCLLVHDEPLGEPARARLTALLELGDGAQIARRDLELRGAGELDGTRQSGDGGFAHLEEFADAPWLERIEADVAALSDGDPGLENHPGLALFSRGALGRASLREQAA